MKKLVKVIAAVLSVALIAAVAIFATGCSTKDLIFDEESKSNEMTVQAKDFYKFVMSKEGQTVLSEEGLVPDKAVAEYPAYTTAKNTLGGKINIIGSTSVQPSMDVLIEEYNDKFQADVEISLSGTGSGQGRDEASKGMNSTFGIVSSGLNDTQKQTLAEYKMGTDGVAVIAPKGITTPVSLTVSQLTSIYKKEGGFTNWSDFGGKDQGIVLYIREASSGTREAFEKPLGLEGVKFEDDNTVVISSSTGTMIQGVSASIGGIGYASFADVDTTKVNVLQVGGVACTSENIKNGTYKIARPFSFVLAKGMVVA